MADLVIEGNYPTRVYVGGWLWNAAVLAAHGRAYLPPAVSVDIGRDGRVYVRYYDGYRQLIVAQPWDTAAWLSRT